MPISYLQRGRGVDPQGFGQRQQSINDLYNRSLAPQQPETHWAQGLARVLQSGISGAQNAGLAKDREAFDQSRQQDLSKLAQVLSGGDYQSSIGELKTPDAQMLGLQLAKSDADRNNSFSQKQQLYDRSREDKRSDMALKFEQQKQLAAMRGAERPSKKEITPINKALNDQRVKGVTTDIESFRNEAKTARDFADKSRRIMQLMASNPNIKSGFGRETITTLQGLANDILPGSFPDVGDQQAFQKELGQFTIAGIKQLKQSGVKSVTQAEVLHLLPRMAPTIANTEDGIKKIAGLFIALEGPAEKAELAMEKALQKAESDPNFDFKDATRRIKQALKETTEAAGISYVNKDLAQKGQRVIPNPNYKIGDSEDNRYLTVPIGQQ